MSDEETDSEAQGVDALRLLKQGIQKSEGVAGKLADSATPQSRSVPLIALLPAQKRSRTPTQDLSDQAPPSGVQKIQQGNVGSAIKRPGSGQQPYLKERSIKGHKSVPDTARALSKELRSCRSAPDLAIPALAAIRGLQDGTLQVDRQTRIRIASAAKRVLEARELRRRASQEGDAHPRYTPYPAAVLDSPPAGDAHLLWEQSSRNPMASSSPGAEPIHSTPSSLRPSRPIETLDSLGTAAAIAGGQLPSPLSRTTSNVLPDAAKGNFHRPALGTVSHSGALLSTSHRPFTITTGLPRFATAEPSGTTEGGQTPPSTPTDPANDNTTKSRAPNPPISKTLCMGDLFKSEGNARNAAK